MTDRFPFQLVYRDTKSPQSERPNHLHDGYEIVYVYSGKGLFFIDNAFYEKTPGDLFIIPNNTIHRGVPDKLNPITSSIVYFSPLLIQDDTFGDSISYLQWLINRKNSKQYKLRIEEDRQHILCAYIETIHEELTQQQRGYKQAALLTLHRIILELIRSESTEDTVAASPQLHGSTWLQEILIHIDNHLSNHLSLSSLAREALVSPEHFSRVFKQMTGMCLTDYIHTKRVIQAQDLLTHSEHKIVYIAEQCGFDSLPHFHRIFKKITGNTPAAYRKLHVMLGHAVL